MNIEIYEHEGEKRVKYIFLAEDSLNRKHKVTISGFDPMTFEMVNERDYETTMIGTVELKYAERDRYKVVMFGEGCTFKVEELTKKEC